MSLMPVAHQRGAGPLSGSELMLAALLQTEPLTGHGRFVSHASAMSARRHGGDTVSRWRHIRHVPRWKS